MTLLRHLPLGVQILMRWDIKQSCTSSTQKRKQTQIRLQVKQPSPAGKGPTVCEWEFWQACLRCWGKVPLPHFDRDCSVNHIHFSILFRINHCLVYLMDQWETYWFVFASSSGLFGLLRLIVFWGLGFWIWVKFLFSVFVFSFCFQFLFAVFVCSFCLQWGLMFLVQKNIADIVGPVVVVAEAQGYTRERTSDLITRVGQCWKNHPTKIISIRRCQSHYANTGKSIIYLAPNHSKLLMKATF